MIVVVVEVMKYVALCHIIISHSLDSVLMTMHMVKCATVLFVVKILICYHASGSMNRQLRAKDDYTEKPDFNWSGKADTKGPLFNSAGKLQ